MKTINKEQLQIFTSYMEDEISVELLQQFIDAKARVKGLEIEAVMRMMNITSPLLLLE